MAVVHVVAAWGFGLAAVFGFIANKTNFCTMGAVSDVLHMGSGGRLGAWFLAIGIAVLGAQALDVAGLVDIGSSMYRTPSFGWPGYIVGGLLFGIGMTLAAGCGQRNLVRLGNGNLKALVVILVFGLTAYTTVRGLLGLVRVNVFDAAGTDLSAYGIESQGLAHIIGGLAGIEVGTGMQMTVAVLVGLAFILVALRQEALRTSFDNLLAGVALGAVVVGGWFLTGYVGNDDFDPVPVESLTFISPAGNTLNYVMTYTGSTINFGIAVVLGVIAGSLVYAVVSRNFRLETFSNRPEMVSHLVGAVLMGFGGVLSLGCTVGQGVTGISTLSVGSMIALFSIVFGSAITMKVQYHMLDEMGFFAALGTGLLELAMPWRDSE